MVGLARSLIGVELVSTLFLSILVLIALILIEFFVPIAFVVVAFDVFDEFLKLLDESWGKGISALTFAPSLVDEPAGASWSYQWAVQYDGTDTFVDVGTEATLAFSAGSPMTEGTHTVRLTLTNDADGNQPPVVHELEVTVYHRLPLDTRRLEQALAARQGCGDQLSVGKPGS